MSYVNSRPNATALCLQNNWGPGTILISTAWKAPRKIHGLVRKADTHICVMIMRENGLCVREEFLKTLPPDVAIKAAGVDGLTVRAP